MIWHDIIMIFCGVLFFLYSNKIIAFLGRAEWFSWKTLLNDNSDEFRSGFRNKKGKYVRLLGLVLLIAGFLDILVTVMR